MRTAIISDIHGNTAWLTVVLADIHSQRCDRILCLGDLVNGGASGAGVIRKIITRGIICIRGNHDESARFPANSPEDLFLRDLPESITEGDCLYIHISPRPGDRPIANRYEAWNVFEATAQRLLFVGRTHVPRIYRLDPRIAGSTEDERFEHGVPFDLDRASRYIISVGSVCEGRDLVKGPRYGIYDDAASTIQIRRPTTSVDI